MIRRGSSYYYHGGENENAKYEVSTTKLLLCTLMGGKDGGFRGGLTT